MGLLKTGVAVDEWKVEPYTKAIEKEGYKILKIFRLSKYVMIIQVEVEETKLKDLKQLLRKLEYTIKRQN